MPPINSDADSATEVAGKILHRAGFKFSRCEMESETQRNRKLQPRIDGRWTFAFHFDGEFYELRHDSATKVAAPGR